MFRKLALMFLVTASSLAFAQQGADTGLVKEGESYNHAASASKFTLVKPWEEVQKPVSNTATLGIRRAFEGVDAIITWNRLYTKMDEAVEIELGQLVQTYGKDKVAKKEAITVNNKPVYVFALSDGPDRNGKVVGAVYLFEAGQDEKNRWRIKVRVHVDKKNEAEGLKAAQALLQQFQW